MTLVVVRGHWARLAWDRLALLKGACLFLSRLRAEWLLRDYALLMQRVIDCLRCTDTVRIWIPTFLLFMHVLAQARLFFSRKLLLGRHLRRAHDVLSGTLRGVLLAAVNCGCGRCTLYVLDRLMDSTA